jgi:hypothetical protein
MGHDQLDLYIGRDPSEVIPLNFFSCFLFGFYSRTNMAPRGLAGVIIMTIYLTSLKTATIQRKGIDAH